MLTTFFIGLFLGFVTAMPVAGPISAMVLSYGMKGRFAQGRLLSLGAALVEGSYAFIAFLLFGQVLAQFRPFFVFSNFITVAVLISLGVYFFRSKRLRDPIQAIKPTGLRQTKAFVTGIAISIANPSVIVTWGTAFGLLQSMKLFENSTATYSILATGIGAGIFIWFSLFLKIIKNNRNRFNHETTDKVLKGFACFLFALSGYLLFKI